MKTSIQLHRLLAACATCFAVAGLSLLTSCGGGDSHDHDHGDHEGHDHGNHDDHDHEDGDEDHESAKNDSGPNGGRILTEVEPHLEFFLMPDHKVQITALTDDAQPAPLGDQIITVTGGDRSAPADLKFTKQGETLISDAAFPKGKKLPVIVQIQNTADAEPVFSRFSLDLSDCPTCDNQEYACVCNHSHPH